MNAPAQISPQYPHLLYAGGAEPYATRVIIANGLQIFSNLENFENGGLCAVWHDLSGQDYGSGTVGKDLWNHLGQR